MSRFKKGKSGNPAGKPRGTRHRATLAVEALLEGEAETLTRKAIELAKTGDTTALRLCLERLAPVRRDAPVSFDAPAMESATDATKALGAILEAVASGDLTPSEASSLSGLIDAFRKTLETEDLERRITALEDNK
ncbi:MAG: DUF5681 domain-containing protein [Pseudomonadota bacterium]